MMVDATSEDLSFINTVQPGSVLHIHGAKISRAMDLAARNRLGIPLLVGEDGIYGHYGCTFSSHTTVNRSL
jgi:beta-glucosidase